MARTGKRPPILGLVLSETWLVWLVMVDFRGTMYLFRLLFHLRVYSRRQCVQSLLESVHFGSKNNLLDCGHTRILCMSSPLHRLVQKYSVGQVAGSQVILHSECL